MPHRSSRVTSRWQATLILALFGLAVVTSAAVGWRYARRSSPHLGPLVLLSVDGLRTERLAAYGGGDGTTPALDALAAESLVFERAYAHTTQTRPSHASLFTGTLPPAHGVRNDVGFSLGREARTLAELLDARGFDTGGAVSSPLLGPESGLNQGFTIYEAGIEADAAAGPVTTMRDGELTIDAIEPWVEGQQDQRFFLFAHVDAGPADAALGRLVDLLKDKGFYDDATILVVGAHGDLSGDDPLAEHAVRVPFIVKQPDAAGAGRRIAEPVQQVDVVPTILDLVRAPTPDGLAGRSLREVLDGEELEPPASGIYSESMAAHFRLGRPPYVALLRDGVRYVRTEDERIEAVDEALPADVPPTVLDALRQSADRLRAGPGTRPQADIPEAQADRVASLGWLDMLQPPVTSEPAMTTRESSVLLRELSGAALLAAGHQYGGAAERLDDVVGRYPWLAPAWYELGQVLLRAGRTPDAVRAFRAAATARPDDAEAAGALAWALLRDGQPAAAAREGHRAAALAGLTAPDRVAAAYEVAARAELAADDLAAAMRDAALADAADAEGASIVSLVQGLSLLDQGRPAEALEHLQPAVAASAASGQEPPRDLYLAFAEALAQVGRPEDADAAYRTQLERFPGTPGAYAGLAMLHDAAGRSDQVERAIVDLLEDMPTPEGFAAAARLWTAVGERERAAQVRADARARFSGRVPAAGPAPR